MTEQDNNLVSEVADMLVKNQQALFEDVIYIGRYETRYKLRPVPERTWLAAGAKIKDPEIPKIKRPDGKEIENTNDPEYQEAVANAAIEKAKAREITLALFGVELLDGMPEQTDWIEKVEYANDIKIDRRKKIELEAHFKYYVLLTQALTNKIVQMSRIDPALIEVAQARFRSDENSPVDKEE